MGAGLALEGELELELDLGLELDVSLGLGLELGPRTGLILGAGLALEGGLELELDWSGEVRLQQGEEGGGGNSQEERQKGEANVRLPVAQLMLGLWRASPGKPRTNGKWASVTSCKVISSEWLPWMRMLVG